MVPLFKTLVTGACLLTLLQTTTVGADHGGFLDEANRIFTDTWAVQVRRDVSQREVRQMADKYGFDHVRKVGSLEDVYQWRHLTSQARSRREATDIKEQLEAEDKIVWLRQQHLLKRSVRSDLTAVASLKFTDPLWEDTWHLNEKSHRRLNTALWSSFSGNLGVEEAWRQGYSGHGATVVIVDDGVEHHHPDLKDNYEADLSIDLNSNDTDPAPRYTENDSNSHGTGCAGVVAALANNAICSVGVAPKATFGGVRLLDGPLMDILEATALSHRVHNVDILTSSWGPEDDGMDLDGPGPLAVEALLHGVTKGRGGLGNLYVWASGNGGAFGDSCCYDGYASSRFTMTISAVSQTGMAPWYAEPCPAVLASAFSSGSRVEELVATTALHGKCTKDFSGTSAAAPMAAGVFALLLEAKSTLTLRDVQHIVALTAQSQGLKRLVQKTWLRNAAGFKFSPFFGFGLLNAAAMISLAANWSTVPPLEGCSVRLPIEARYFTSTKMKVYAAFGECLPQSGRQLGYVEQVTLIMTIRETRRSSTILDLVSPSGTRVRILYPRPRDTRRSGLFRWPVSTSFFWGEQPQGVWTMEVSTQSAWDRGWFLSAELLVSGTSVLPPLYPHNAVPKLTSAKEVSSSDNEDLLLRFASEIEYDGDRYSNALRSLDSLPHTLRQEEEIESRPMETVGMSAFDNVEALCDFESDGKHSGECLALASDEEKCASMERHIITSATGKGILCVTECTNGTFAVPRTAFCQPCRFSCLQCSALNKCVQCRQGYVLHDDVCIGRCPVGFYSSEVEESEAIILLADQPEHIKANESDIDNNHTLTNATEGDVPPETTTPIQGFENEMALNTSRMADEGPGFLNSSSDEPAPSEITDSVPPEGASTDGGRFPIGEHILHRYLLAIDSSIITNMKNKLDLIIGERQKSQRVCMPCPKHCSSCHPHRDRLECVRCQPTHYQLEDDDGVVTCLEECPEGYVGHTARSSRKFCRVPAPMQ